MAVKRKALGRGLNALLPPAPVGAGDKALLELPIDSIIPNKHQPRSAFHPERLSELVQSIKSNGVVQPVIVRKSGNHYQLIAGERRWRAARMAGLHSIPAIVRDVSEYKTLELALIENIQREDLNPVEEATAYASLIDEFQLTQDEVAHRVGKDRSSIANYLRLLKLPADIKEKIASQNLTMGHARALTSLERAKDQNELANRIISEHLNVRQAEELIRKWKQSSKHGKSQSTPAKQDANTRAAETRLQEKLGTKVSIQQSGDKGKIEIYFHDQDDLIRIFDLIIGE